MDGLTLAAFICYLLSAVGSTIFSIIYLTRPKFMPYHQEALGQDWNELDAKLKVLIIAFMRVIGGSVLATSLGIMVILFIPFRSGELWASYAIPAIGLVAALPSLYATLTVRLRTHASAPVVWMAAGVLLIVVGFMLSLL